MVRGRKEPMKTGMDVYLNWKRAKEGRGGEGWEKERKNKPNGPCNVRVLVQTNECLRLETSMLEEKKDEREKEEEERKRRTYIWLLMWQDQTRRNEGAGKQNSSLGILLPNSLTKYMYHLTIHPSPSSSPSSSSFFSPPSLFPSLHSIPSVSFCTQNSNEQKKS